MKHLLEKYGVGILVLLIIVLSFFLFSKGGKVVSKEYVSKINNPYLGTIRDSNLPLGTTITCEFSEESVFSIHNGEQFITHKASKDSEPIILTFINYNSADPQLKGNANTVDLISVNRVPQTVVLAEKTEIGDVFFYTIFPEAKVAVWQKAYSILDLIPFSLNSMGYCY